MRLKIFCVFVLLITSSFPLASSQKWGKVSKEVLSMTSIPDDPEADAVILFDKCRIQITSNFNLDIQRHRRIKILTERGKEYADISIRFWHEDKVKRIKAHTILPNGKKIKLKRKEIFEKKDYQHKEKIFAFPGVEVGSVIEYKYDKFSEYLHYLEPWYFQGKEFTRLSELTVVLPSGFNYNAFFTNIKGGLEPIEERMLTPDSRGRPPRKFTWRMENLPAIRPEPYVKNFKDYFAAVYFQLVSFTSPYQKYEFIKSWDDLAKTVNDIYKPSLSQKKGLKELAAAQISTAENRPAQIQTLYNYVKDMIETSAGVSPLSSLVKKPKKIVEDKKGSDIGKNLLLINLLRHAGFQANPMLISTRTNGFFRREWVQLQQFDHTIVNVQLGNKSYLMDTRNQYIPFGVLPANDLAYAGLLVDGETGKIVSIPSPVNVNMRFVQTNATLSETGNLRCETILRYEGYRAMAMRKKLATADHEEYVTEFLQDRFEEVSLDSFKINNLDGAELPLTVFLQYQIQNYAQMVGDMVYLTPSLIHRLDSNPFEREKRIYPVEYSYPRASTENVTFTLPAGFRILEVPRLARQKSKLVSFIAGCKPDSNKIEFQRYLRINKDTYQPREYTKLRDHYEKIVSSDQGQIVIGRKEDYANEH